MKTVLIIYPHFPPSNLAGVHRPRLFAQHLPSFGWTPVVLTVDEKHYEEKLDWNLAALLPKDLRIEKTGARPIGKRRMIGDIGLRAFSHLYKKAKKIIRNEQIDFVYIPIPSFYCSLLGRLLHRSTGVKYGIDYIDPWVHDFPGSNKLFSRHWFSKKLASILEPIAVKKASLIMGVAEGYYAAVLERNPSLKNKVVTGAMPYGGEKADHLFVHEKGLSPYLFTSNGKIQLVYAGAMLPKAYAPLEEIFKEIASHPEVFAQVEIHFIGTGKTPDDASGHNIKPLAEKYGLWQTVVFEYPQRIPYLDVLSHLNIADGIFILGSTEPHYTPSKTYQGVLSGKPLFAVLHSESSAVNVIRSTNAGVVLDFSGEKDIQKIQREFVEFFTGFINFLEAYSPANINMAAFDQYSAKAVTKQLAELMDKAIKNNSI